MAAIDRWIEEMADYDLLLYQACADPHIEDPLVGWLTTDELRERDRRVFRAARARCLGGLETGWRLPEAAPQGARHPRHHCARVGIRLG